MGNIRERKRKDGTVGYLARVRVERDGESFADTQTFDRRAAAKAWINRREKELAQPGGIERAKAAQSPTLGDAIRVYVQDYGGQIGRTKAGCLSMVTRQPIAEMHCEDIEPHHLVDWMQSIDAQPQTIANHASHLLAVFAVAGPMWGYKLNYQVAKDAITVARRMKIIARSKSRDRVPTLAELELILDYFTERRRRVPQMLPMVKVVLFGLFSTRRQEEIVTIRWDDYQPQHGRVLVRDMKNPGEKEGNNVWCKLPPEAMAVIDSMPRKGERIFPYSTDAVSANFTRAVKYLGIDDLRFHDLRHAGTSRLFEMGWQIPNVATVTGHRSWQSLKRYTHIVDEGDRYAGWEWNPLTLYSEPEAV